MSTDFATMPGMDEAAKLFGDQFPDAGQAESAAVEQREEQPDTRAGGDEVKARPTATEKSTDTQATAEQPEAKQTPTEQTAEKAEKTGKAEAEKSRYAKSAERLEKTWASVNARKSELEAQATALEQEKLTIARERAEIEAFKQSQAPEHNPKDVQSAAQKLRTEADAMRMRAKRAEDAGQYEQAQQLEKQANRSEAKADDLDEYAERLAKNPPTGFAERQKALEQQRQQWTLEAAKSFPDLAKSNSTFQRAVATSLQELAKADPTLAAHPSIIYHVCRLTAAEAAAARVPALEKEAEQLRAKVSELEKLTSPAGDGNVPALGTGSNSDADEYAEIMRMAEGRLMKFG